MKKNPFTGPNRMLHQDKKGLTKDSQSEKKLALNPEKPFPNPKPIFV
jgi:hypothetical protein